MKNFSLVIAAPDGKIFDGEATQLSVRGTEGSLSVLAGHIPFVCAVVPCVLRVYENGVPREAVCGDGFLTVTHESTRLLVTSFEWKEEKKD